MKKKRSWKQLKKDIYRARAIYLMILPVVVWFLLFPVLADDVAVHFLF